MRTRAFPLLTAFILICAPLDFYTSAVANVVCGNSNTYWCSEQEETYTYRWNKQGQNAQPVDNSHQGDESIQTDQGEIARRQEEHQRWYREHHHGEFGFAQGKNGDQQSFGFDVANDGSYCLSRDGQAGTFEKAPKTGRAIPDMINELYGNKCTLNDPEAVKEAQGEYERIITEMRTHLLELIPAHPHLTLDSAHPPHTSKGEETNFYTTLEGSSNIFEGDLPIGHTRIRAVPVAYRYEYGDGQELRTHQAGTPRSSSSGSTTTSSSSGVKETSTSYAYPQVGNFHAYVTVTYAGQYSIDGGPWQFFGTEITRISEPVLVRVWESEVHSVGKTCIEDPGARGCPGHAEEPDVENPNPQLRKVDVYTGQRWHLDDVGVGDSEGRLHPTWPNM